MKTTDRQIMEHILNYCKEVDETIDRFGRDFETFKDDNIYHNALSMPLFQIGELTKRFTVEFRAATEEKYHWKQIAGMRDRYAHGYQNMNLKTIWTTTTEDIPVLKGQCEEMLAKIEEQIKEDEAHNDD